MGRLALNGETAGQAMIQFFTILDRLVRVISLAAAVLAAAILLMIFVIVQYEVVMRYVFNAPTSWTNEVSMFAIAWVGFLGAGYILRIGRQLEIDVVTMRISPRARRWLGTATDLLGAVFCAIIAKLSYDFVVISEMIQATSASELDTPLWIPYLALPIGFTILGMELVVRIFVRWNLVRGRDADHAPVHVD